MLPSERDGAARSREVGNAHGGNARVKHLAIRGRLELLLGRLARWVLGVAATYLAILLGGIFFFNAEFYSSRTERSTLTERTSSTDPIVLVRLTELPAAQNSASLSVHVIARDSALMDSLRFGTQRLFITLRDGSGARAYTSIARVVMDSSNSFPEDRRYLSTREHMATLPLLRKVNPYPFDDVVAFLSVSVEDVRGWHRPFVLIVEKGFPGRRLSLQGQPVNAELVLYRPRVEQGFVLASAFVLVIITAALIVRLHRSDRTPSTTEELVAVAGLVLGAASFRELLGISRVPGITALEVVVLGVPLILLTIGFLRSALSKLPQATDD